MEGRKGKRGGREEGGNRENLCVLTGGLFSFLCIWDRIREKGPNACFFKFRNYLIF